MNAGLNRIDAPSRELGSAAAMSMNVQEREVRLSECGTGRWKSMERSALGQELLTLGARLGLSFVPFAGPALAEAIGSLINCTGQVTKGPCGGG